MATQIVVTTTTVAELKEILNDMCNSGQAQVITVGDKAPVVTKPDTAAADKAAADAKAKADKAAADKLAAEKKAKADKLAKLKAEAAALEAGEEPPATEETKPIDVNEYHAQVKARIAELKGSTAPNIVADISAWKAEKGAPSLNDMDFGQLTALLAFINEQS